MSKEPATQAGASRSARLRGGWTLGIGDPETVLAGARRALFVMTGILVVIWGLQIANYADSYYLTHSYGIMPRDISSLPNILFAPLLHFSWTHIEGNSGPLFIFGFLAAYRGIGKFAALTAIVVLTSGFAAWFFETTNSVGAGASGVVFGYFGYIIVRGLFDRHVIDLLLGAVMALCFAYQFAVLLPHQGIGWQAHVGGLAGGIVSGWLLRDRRASARSASAARPAGASAAVEPASSVWLPSASGSQPAKSKKAEGKDLAVDPSNPRAELYKQLDDMGL
jgi:membrane associated rhomboid family serine protease